MDWETKTPDERFITKADLEDLKAWIEENFERTTSSSDTGSSSTTTYEWPIRFQVEGHKNTAFVYKVMAVIGKHPSGAVSVTNSAVASTTQDRYVVSDNLGTLKGAKTTTDSDAVQFYVEVAAGTNTSATKAKVPITLYKGNTGELQIANNGATTIDCTVADLGAVAVPITIVANISSIA